MPTWFSQLRNLVWSAVLAVIIGFTAMIAAVLGADIASVAGIGAFGLILAVLAQKS